MIYYLHHSDMRQANIISSLDNCNCLLIVSMLLILNQLFVPHRIWGKMIHIYISLLKSIYRYIVIYLLKC